MSSHRYDRRRFLINASQLTIGTAGLGLLSACGDSKNGTAPAIIIPDSQRPKLPSGIQIGDVNQGRATIWARADRAARMRVEYDFSDSFKNPQRVMGPLVTESSDFTGRLELSGLPQGQSVFLRVAYEHPDNAKVISEITSGQFRTAPLNDGSRPIRFVWGGDVAGQGWGINADFGGMKIFEAMRQRQPDFFLHSGDAIYADGPIAASVTLEDGRIWKNVVTPEVSKVAESLNEFRGRYRYNLMDENVRRFAAEVPQIWQWDDHEITNNWSPSKDLSGNQNYTEKNINTLVQRGRQAFLEYSPMQWRSPALADQRIYRKIAYGALLDVFVLDMRSYRAANGNNLESTESDKTVFLGKKQLDWLIKALAASTATWKVIAADMPIGLRIADGKDATGADRWEAISNGNDGVPLGRELEIAGLLRATKAVKNIVWLTADVHYCAAHYYDNAKAKFTDFTPFWEFVAGPLNAGTFGPNTLDATFGPQVIFQKAPAAGKVNLSPLDGYQFFGEVTIDPQSKALQVNLIDLNGKVQFNQVIAPDLSS